jgi:hypothetical protein
MSLPGASWTNRRDTREMRMASSLERYPWSIAGFPTFICSKWHPGKYFDPNHRVLLRKLHHPGHHTDGCDTKHPTRTRKAIPRNQSAAPSSTRMPERHASAYSAHFPHVFPLCVATFLLCLWLTETVSGQMSDPTTTNSPKRRGRVHIYCREYPHKPQFCAIFFI